MLTLLGPRCIFIEPNLSHVTLQVSWILTLCCLTYTLCINPSYAKLTFKTLRLIATDKEGCTTPSCVESCQLTGIIIVSSHYRVLFVELIINKNKWRRKSCCIMFSAVPKLWCNKLLYFFKGYALCSYAISRFGVSNRCHVGRLTATTLSSCCKKEVREI